MSPTSTGFAIRGSVWGILDQYGTKHKNYYAFKAFRAMLDTALRVKTTPNDAATGYALLAGLGEDAQAGVLLANHRAREANFTLTLKGWPSTWNGSAVCRRNLLDYDRNLTLVEEHRLDYGNATVDLCMPAPAFCYMTVTPA